MIDTVFLLPGQGSYRAGLFAGNQDPELREVLDTVDRVAAEFGRAPVSPLLQHPQAPSAEHLASTDSFALQLAIFAAGVAAFRLALRQARPDVLVGHSMGEIAALTAAGAFDLADGARLVCHRSAALLDNCAQAGSMIAFGLNARRAEALVELVDVAGLAVAVRNAPGHTVLAGPDAGLHQARQLAESIGVQVTRLPAPFPFHSPQLGLAGPAFRAAIRGIQQHPLRLRVYAPVAGRYLDDTVDAKELLVRQLTGQVDFLAAVQRLHADGARTFVECGSAGLSGLVRRSVPEVQASTVEWPAPSQSAATYGQQPAGFGQAGSYGQQPAGFGQADAFGQPAAAFGQPPAAYGQPPAAFGQPAAAFGQPAAAFGQPAAAFGQPAAAFGQSAAAFGHQAPAYGQQAPSYGNQPAEHHQQPTFLQPATVPPAVLQPAVVQPAVVQPATGGPVYLQPAAGLEQPAYLRPAQPPTAFDPASTPASQPAPQPAGSGGAGAGSVLQELLSLYATSLGYPLEAMTADADLEADLGIDSLKRAEMLGKVRAHFGLSDSAEDGRFLAQSTLGELAELVAESR
jgi:[acyl-carrier-protein] S-malonyltransferase